MENNKMRYLLMLGLLLIGCDTNSNGSAESLASEQVVGNGADVAAAATQAEENRIHDSRTFVIAEPDATTFEPMLAAPGDIIDMQSTSRWAGVLDKAAYRIEVPQQWNGTLVMYAHGSRGGALNLTIDNPRMRRHLIQNGYAWAASSYSANFYDVRAGIEDTNALALAFNSIASANGRSLTAPVKRYIIGPSMGGHVAAAAVERETLATANHNVRYDAAMPMCGVVGGPALFSNRAALYVSAAVIAGVSGEPLLPLSAARMEEIKAALFTSFPSVDNPQAPIEMTASGQRFAAVMEQFTGGSRPLFDEALRNGGSFVDILAAGRTEGTVNGILARPAFDTTAFNYVFADDAQLSATLNAALQQVKPDPEANRLRRDGLRWIPLVNGEFDVPVLTAHTLGDLEVLISMQQVYRRNAERNGSGDLLVQRAVRGLTHCDFTVAEWVESFEALVAWERDGIKPAGDDLLSTAKMADPTFGCAFTNNTTGPDEFAGTQLRLSQIAACAPP